MKSKNEIIEELYATEFVEKYISQLVNSIDMVMIDDLRGEVWLQICEIDEEKLKKLYKKGKINKVRQFVGGLIYRQIRSKTSVCYTKYKKNYLNTICVEDFVKYNNEDKDD